jgi:small subunit ribosomal protein S21
MPKKIIRENESIDDALRTFKKQVNKSGILNDLKNHEHYLKPGLKRRTKKEQSRRHHN